MKKAIALVLTILLSVSVLPAVGGSAASLDAEESAALLTRLGVYSQMKEEQWDAAVTRGEFAQTLCKLLRIDPGAFSSGAKAFYDLAPGHPAFDAVMALRQLSILNGFGDNTFQPDEPIIIENVAGALVHALGYGQKASLSGGTTVIANQLGLLSGMKPAGQTTWRELSALLVRAATAPLMRETEIGGQSVTYETNDAITLLSEYYDIYEERGVMLASGITSLSGEEVPEGVVLIDQGRYLSDGEYNGLLGCEVSFFYRDDRSNRTLVYAYKSRNVDELTVAAEDVQKYAGGRLYYNEPEGGRKQDVSIAANHKLVYNGVLLPDYDASVFKPDNGTVRIVSNDGGGTYLYVFIDTFLNLPMSAAEYTDGWLDLTNVYAAPKVRFYHGNGSHLTISDSNGKTVAPDELATIDKGTVLSIYADKTEVRSGIRTVSDDATVLKIIINLQTVTGKAEAKGTQDSKEYYTIDGKDYFVSSSNFIEDSKLEIGQSGTFYLDADGKLVHFSEGDEALDRFPYGYIMALSIDNSVSPVITAKLLTQEGEIRKAELAERVTLNGESKRDMKEVYQFLMDNAIALNKTKPYSSDPNSNMQIPDAEMKGQQLVKYGVNQDGKINKIETALLPTEPSQKDRMKLEKPLTYLMTRSNMGYDFMYGSWAGTTSYGSEFHKPKLLLNVPVHDAGLPESVAFRLMPSIEDEEQYWIEPYSFDEGMTPEVGIIYTLSSLGRTNEYPVMVDQVMWGVDEDGEEVTQIKCYNGISAFTYTVLADYPKTDDKYRYDFETLKKGDVIQLYGVGDRPAAYEKYVDIDHLEDVSTEPSLQDNINRRYFAEVYYANNKSLVLQRGPLEPDGVQRSKRWSFYYGGTHIMGGVVYDFTGAEPKVRLAKATDIRSAYFYGDSASRVFAYSSYGEPRFMAIYNF